MSYLPIYHKMLKYQHTDFGGTAPNAEFKSPLDQPSAPSVSEGFQISIGVWNMGDREIEACILVRDED
jgi:hypothetical protein